MNLGEVFVPSRNRLLIISAEAEATGRLLTPVALIMLILESENAAC